MAYTDTIETTGFARRIDIAARTRWIWIGALAVFVAVIAIVSIIKAAHRPFWYDEICTVVVVKQTGLSGQWNALMNGIDMNPPGFHVLETPFARLIPKAEIGYRMAPLLGCLVMQIGLFWFAKRSGGYAGGLAAAILPSLTLALLFFDEARPYGLVLGFSTLALVFWQRCDRKVFAVGLACSLAAGVSCHYYVAFVMACIGFAEVLATILTRKFRPVVWLALIVSASPVLIFLPLIHHMKEYYSGKFWAAPQKSYVLSAYGMVLDLGKGMGLTLVVILVAGLLILLWNTKRESRSHDTALIQDICAALGMIALPSFAVPVTMLAHGGLTDRYMLPTILGIAIGAGLLLGRTRRMAAIPVIASFWVLAVCRHIGGPLPKIDMEPLDQELVTQFLDQNPNAHVVISDGLAFLPMAYYAPPQLASRMYALIDPKAALHYVSNDSIEVALPLIRKYLPIHLITMSELGSQTVPFYMFTDHRDAFDWASQYMLDSGYKLTVVKLREKSSVYALQPPSHNQ